MQVTDSYSTEYEVTIVQPPKAKFSPYSNIVRRTSDRPSQVKQRARAERRRANGQPQLKKHRKVI